jgi:hypothetical protein
MSQPSSPPNSIAARPRAQHNLPLFLRVQALDVASALAVCPFTASWSASRTQLGTFEQPSLWPPIPPTLHETILRASPDPRRRLAVVPLIREQRYYGESPARVRRGHGGVSRRFGRYPTYYPENSEEPKTPGSEGGFSVAAARRWSYHLERRASHEI